MSSQLSAGFHAAIAALDKANALDPNKEADGQPHELADAKRMTAWVHRLVKEPSEELLLAARAAHLCRWEIPRSSFPMDKKGYLQWRRKLYGHQAEKAGGILAGLGYPNEIAGRVGALVSKAYLSPLPLRSTQGHEPSRMANPPPQAGRDLERDARTMEDALCLVFLENEFESFRAKHDESKLLGVVRKTWAKMSESGKEAALGIHFGEEAKAVLAKAISSP